MAYYSKILNLLLLLVCGPLLAQEKVPVLVPLTGSAAEQGLWIKQGVEIAKMKMQKSGQELLEPVFEDTQANPKQSISSYYKIKSDSNFRSIITYGSGVGLALSSVANSDKVIQVGVATSVPTYRSLDDFNFRIFPSAELDSNFTVDTILKKLNEKNIGIIYIQNEYGAANKNAVAAKFKDHGGNILFEEEIEPGLVDAKALIQKIKVKNPQVIYLAAYPNEGAIFLKQAKELGLKSKIIAGTAIVGSNSFLHTAKEAADGIYITSPNPAFMKSEVKAARDFVEGYKELYGITPSVEHLFAARAFDAYSLLHRAHGGCLKEDSECLKKYLHAVKDYEGASGNITFDKYGDVGIKFVLFKIESGQLIAQPD